MDDSIKLAKIYYKNGFTNVLAKSGVHHGTYKVFVNFFPVADLTQIDSRLFNKLSETAYMRKGIYYCPPDFLRMNMYLELSRPKGDVSRWEKVYNRLELLNKNYPINISNCDIRSVNNNKEYYNKIVNVFIKNNSIFFGGKALEFYSKYNKELSNRRTIIDIFNSNPKQCINELKKVINTIKVEKKEGIHEVLPDHHVISINNSIVAIIYEPIACYSYITITENNKSMQ